MFRLWKSQVGILGSFRADEIQCYSSSNLYVCALLAWAFPTNLIALHLSRLVLHVETSPLPMASMCSVIYLHPPTLSFSHLVFELVTLRWHREMDVSVSQLATYHSSNNRNCLCPYSLILTVGKLLKLPLKIALFLFIPLLPKVPSYCNY